MTIIKTLYMAVVVLFILTLTACNVEDGKVTGGGNMLSVSDGGRAILGFNADSCGGGDVTGKFNFHDSGFKGAAGGLKMMGAVTGVDKCVEQGDGRRNASCSSSFYHSAEGCQEGYVVSMDYRSTNPKALGTGVAVACLMDNGKKGVDGLWVKVKSGPFEGYYNHGKMKGNIQSHKCEDNA